MEKAAWLSRSTSELWVSVSTYCSHDDYAHVCISTSSVVLILLDGYRSY